MSQKNKANFRKHGIWFEEGKSIWADTLANEFFEPDHSQDEDRYFRIGLSSLNKVLLVVFCERGPSHIIRIISARRATQNEQEQYEKGV